MPVLLHLSDTHFGTERPAVVRGLLQLAAGLRPDLLVLSGDVTQRARTVEFRAARSFCDTLPAVPCLAIPGNHDIPLLNLAGRLLHPYRGWSAVFGPVLEPVLDRPDALVLGVNTTRPWRHKHGAVSADQVARVAERLRRARPGQLRIVVTHQPAAVVRTVDVPDRLRGGPQALLAWAAAGADVVLGGHIHRPSVMRLDAPRPLWCVQAGTAVSARVREGTGNSINQLVWADEGGMRPAACELTRWDWSETAGAFETASRRTLILSA